MWSVWGRGKGYTGLWWGKLRERDHLEDPGIGDRIILRWTFRMWDGVSWRGLFRFWIGTGGCSL